jgi:hypothetical protein
MHLPKDVMQEIEIGSPAEGDDRAAANASAGLLAVRLGEKREPKQVGESLAVSIPKAMVRTLKLAPEGEDQAHRAGELHHQSGEVSDFSPDQNPQDWIMVGIWAIKKPLRGKCTL